MIDAHRTVLATERASAHDGEPHAGLPDERQHEEHGLEAEGENDAVWIVESLP